MEEISLKEVVVSRSVFVVAFVALRCERYELKIDYIGSSMYMVTVHGEYTIIWISIFYILGIVTW